MKLELKNICIEYDGLTKKLYENFNCTFETGSFALMGESGCGKSTLLRAIENVDCVKGEHRKGKVFLDGKEPTSSEIIMMFQNYPVFPWLNVEQNVRFSKKNGDVEGLMKRLGLWEHRKKKVGQWAREISGGQEQRLSLAMTLMYEPKVLLLDEPTAALDKENVKIVADLLKEYAKKHIVICVTHSDYFLQCLGAKKIDVGDENIRVRVGGEQ